jgi:NAD(P)-dependent dehydrogenase (short-subunit alcohol dehydrogenase family)
MCSRGRRNRCGRRRGLFPEAGVTSEADWASAVSETITAYGQIDILGNNAGIIGSHPDRLNTNNWDEQMEVFAEGPFLVMQIFIPIVQKLGQASVSLVSGLAGLPWIHMGYNAAKGAVRLATKAIRLAGRYPCEFGKSRHDARHENCDVERRSGSVPREGCCHYGPTRGQLSGSGLCDPVPG